MLKLVASGLDKVQDKVHGKLGTADAPAPAAQGAAQGGPWWQGAVSDESREEAARELEAEAADGERAICPDVGWIRERRAQGAAPDGSQQFAALLAKVRAGEHELARRWDLSFLIVPGLFCQRYGPIYMRQTRKHLTSLGLDARVLKINTEASVDANAQDIARQARAAHAQTGKRVVLVGHSKGGCDAVAAICKHPDLHRFVVAFVALQAPLGGTPLATDALKCAAVRKAMGNLVTATGGDAACMRDLTYEARRQAISSCRFPYERIRAVTLSTRSLSKGSLLCPLQRWMHKRYGGLENDGMVASCDADLPEGSLRVFLADEMDHSGPAFPATPWATVKGEQVNEAAILLAVQGVPHVAPPPAPQGGPAPYGPPPPADSPQYGEPPPSGSTPYGQLGQGARHADPGQDEV